MYTGAIITAALAATAAAAPAVVAPRTSIVVYSLKTKSANPAFNDKCIVGYHTGAGLDDATLTPCTTSTELFYTNGTAIESTQFSGSPSGLQVITATSSYEDWLPVTIDAGYGTTNLKFTKDKQVLQENGHGFLACNWNHGGVAQLFSVITLAGFKLPSSCAEVKLYHG
jgi:hypothetical protein